MFSQARQFFISQTLIEQRHIADALAFELSKCERMVGHLLNIDSDLAQTVADGLGMVELPAAASAAVTPRTDLPASDMLSILKNPPPSIEGRKIGVLVTEGADIKLLKALQDAIIAEGAVIEIIAPTIGGVTLSDGTLQPAHHKIDGAPSVLFDAVALLITEEGVLSLMKLPPARDFVIDAYSHYKFLGFTEPAAKFFAKIGLPEDLDDGFIAFGGLADASDFVTACRSLRFWDRPDGA